MTVSPPSSPLSSPLLPTRLPESPDSPSFSTPTSDSTMSSYFPSSSMAAIAFWFMGLLNNIPYVIMIAGAKSISEGGTALVFIANVLPGLLVKLSAPYWFEKVSYEKRMGMGSFLMTSSFVLVAFFGSLREKDIAALKHDEDYYYDGVNYYDSDKKKIDFCLIMQLLGVACCSTQGSLGEATLLALSGKADSIIAKTMLSTSSSNDDGTYAYAGSGDESDQDNALKKGKKSYCITAFSSGTGLAGVLGFAYIFLLTKVIKLSLTAALYLAMIFPLCYWFLFKIFLLQLAVASLESNHDTIDERDVSIGTSHRSNSIVDDGDLSFDGSDEERNEERDQFLTSSPTKEHVKVQNDVVEMEDGFNDNHPTSMTSLEIFNDNDSLSTDENYIKTLSIFQRLRLTLSFWPYMIPLFIVYAAEYALQSGVWTAIGFPVDSIEARESFYQKSNWLYQVGVFISRTSGACFIAPMWMLWLMPLLQCMNLVFFYFVATYHVWYNNELFIVCFYTGLLGGSVYVNGYMRVNKDLHISIREFALSTVSIADSLGIVLADVSGLFIQSCLYKSNGIKGAIVSCPIK